MGTFQLVLNGVSARAGKWATDAGGDPVSDADMLLEILATDGLFLFANDPTSIAEEAYTATYSCTGACWKLDGGAAISFSGLPAGFNVLTCGVAVNRTNEGFGTPHDYYASLPGSGPGEGSANSPKAYSSPLFPPTLSIQNNGCGIRCQVGNSDLNSRIKIDSIILSGTYNILSFSWTIANPTVPVRMGDNVSISSPAIAGLIFTGIPSNIGGGVSDINISYFSGGSVHVINIPTANIITQTATQLVFTIPTGFGTFTGKINIVVTGDGTQITGDQTLGDLNMVIADASGIYKIVADKTADTLYISSQSSNSTEDVKIPDPFIKTGFIGT